MLGLIKVNGNDSSVLFWIPWLCSPSVLSMYNWFGQYIDMAAWGLVLMQRLQLIKCMRYTFYNTGEQRKIPQNLSCFSDNLVPLIKIVSRDIYKFREDTSKNRFRKVL